MTRKLIEEYCVLRRKNPKSILHRSMLIVKMAKMNGLVVPQSVHLAQIGTAKSNLGTVLLCAN